MALRELLSSSQREAIEAIPVDRAGLIQHYVLNEADLNLIRRRRGNRNRLGFAVQLGVPLSSEPKRTPSSDRPDLSALRA